MTIEFAESDGVKVARVAGAFNAEVADEIRAAVVAAGARGARLIIDLAEATPLLSSGLVGLVDLNSAITKSGGRLVLASLQPGARKLGALTKLLPLFTVAETFEAAKAEAAR